LGQAIDAVTGTRHLASLPFLIFGPSYAAAEMVRCWLCNGS